MKKSFGAILTLAVVGILVGVMIIPAIAQGGGEAVVPTSISYQGLLTDDQGDPIETPVDITFTLYTELNGGTPVWAEVHREVDPNNGLFSVELGGNGSPIYAAMLDGDRYLGVEVNTDGEMTPRQKVTSVPYALVAEQANYAFSLNAPDGEPQDAVYVDNAGKVGIGTTSPAGVFETFLNDIEREYLDQESIASLAYPPFGWQSFTAGITGKLSRVDLCIYYAQGTSNFNLYSGEGNSGTLVYTQAVSFVNGWNQVNIGTPVDVVSGEKCTIELIDGGTQYWYHSSFIDGYPNGKSNHAEGDYSFMTYVTIYIDIDAILVDDFGRVSIGNDLTVSGHRNATVNLKRQDDNFGSRLLFQNSGNNYEWNIYQTAGTSSNLHIASGNNSDYSQLVDCLTISNSGNVGIIGYATIGDPMKSGQSTWQGTSSYAYDGYVETPWVYASMIEAPNERGAASTGVAVGSYNGFTSDDQISLITSGNERLRVNSDGKVGIGTVNPSTELEVAGTVTATAFVGDGSGLTGTGDTDWNINGNDIYHQAGRVGIGLNDPSTELEVAGTVTATAFAGDGSGLTGTGDTDWVMTGNDIYHDLGFVGIGTTSPLSPLHVSGSATIGSPNGSGQSTWQGTSDYANDGYLETPWVYASMIESPAERGATSTGIAVGAGNGYTSNDQISLITDGNEVLRVNMNGRVGIGLTNPDSTLQVEGTARAIELLSSGTPEGMVKIRRESNETGGGKLLFQNSGGWYEWNIYQTDGVDSDFRIAGGSSQSNYDNLPNRLTITNDGKVGIGTTDPQSKLQVNGYIQLDTVSGAPPATDCDDSSEYGRMKFDPTSNLCYICGSSGWVTK